MSKKSFWTTDVERQGRNGTYTETVPNYGNIIKFCVGCVALLIAFLVLNPIACVGTTERGVKTMFNAVVGDDVLMPGVHFKVPLVGGVITRSITPNESKIQMRLNRNAAVSLDTQEIGVQASVFWRYDETKIAHAIRSFTKQNIDEILLRAASEGLRTVIGTYTVFDIGQNTTTIANAALENAISRVTHLPIVIVDLIIEDFDWSAEVDRIVEQRVVATASIERARADADRVEQEQRRVSIEAEAEARATVARAEAALRAAQLNSEAMITTARGEAEARRLEGQGEADYNRLIGNNFQVQQARWNYEVALMRATKLAPGTDVPMYIPLAPNGSAAVLQPGR